MNAIQTALGFGNCLNLAAGKRAEARASWWGFDPADARMALQAAIHSGARTLIVEDIRV